jgi:hypothetical protein
MPLRKRKGKQGKSAAALSEDKDPAAAAERAEDAPPPASENPAQPAPQANDGSPPSLSEKLILTSEKRRGVYECDYCHCDISQNIRVRCAVCPDFDLCLDCFATTDHAAAIARLKAASASETALQDAGVLGNMAVVKHDHTHGYRVCDSTRYPLFPTSRSLSAASNKWTTSTVAPSESSALSDAGVDSALETSSNVSSAGGKKDAPEDAMDVDKNEEEEAKPAEESEIKTPAESTVTFSENDKAPTVRMPRPIDATVSFDATLSFKEDDAATSVVFQPDDPKNIWTIEEDLRLLEAIRAHGLGNWTDISEAVGGNGSVGKTPKRCMERYFDDYLGRYGHILPPYTLITESEDDIKMDDDNDAKISAAGSDTGTSDDGGEAVRTSKRRAVMFRSPSAMSTGSLVTRKKYRAVPTESVPEFENFWPNQFLPPKEGIQVGQEVGRNQTWQAEQAYVRTVAALETKEQVEKVRKEWEEHRLNKPGGPTVLPMRQDDVATLPGSELAGFMPRRGDFDVEWDNDAEQAVADMEFLPGESEQDKQLKLQVLAIYNSKLDEREKRKKFVLNRKLYDYRQHQKALEQLPRDERDLVNRMRLFERFHTPEEHRRFIADLLKAKRLRKEIAKLQMYRRLGIRTLLEAEKYELEKSRRTFHKSVSFQKEAEAKKAEAAGAASASADATMKASVTDESESSVYWRRYRTSDRKIRRSINRSPTGETAAKEGKANSPEETSGAVEMKPDAETSHGPRAEGGSDPTGDVDSPGDMTEGAKNAASEETEKPSLEEKPQKDELAHLPGYALLSPREVELCRSVELVPAQYLEVKKALIHESLKKGLLDKDGWNRRTLVQIDVERRGAVIDFIVRAGWIAPKLGNIARTVTP